MNNQIFNAKNLFQLPKDIILEYENKPSPFGFDGLGEFIYHRTYSRVKDGSSQTETWPETVYRVVNGNYSIQKQHIINSGLPWDEEHGMRSAREMYDRIFHMKFLPPGRGLWASGTDITDKKGLYSALNNCGAVSTADIANIYDKPFRFIMDMLMLGVGMGFDTKGAGTIEVFDPAVNNQNEYQLPKRMRAQDNNNAINVMNNYKKFVQDVIDNTKRNLANETDEWKKSTYQKDIELYTNDLEYFSQFNPYQICTHVVEDTREGWVNATGLVIRSHMQPGHYPVVIDYSKIRPAGILLKTFGGKSSGPEPLLELHCMLRKRIIKNANGENASNDNSSLISHTTITDIVNLIAKCVVAGNIRRSATISMGPYDSAEFMDLKDYSKNPDRIDFGWCSNNSILGKLGMDYEEIAERIKINGEPGIAWFENVNNHARMNNVKDTRDARAELFNPCFHGDTLIAVADGRGAVPIKQLAEEDKDVPVYTMAPNGDVEIKYARKPRKTRENTDLVEVTFEDGSSVKVTPDHKFILLNGNEIEAKDLKEGDSLPRFKRYLDTFNGSTYSRLYTNVHNNTDREVEHRMIGKFHHADKFNELFEAGKMNGAAKTGNVIFHHKNENKLDNRPENLEVMTFAEHCKHHGEELTGEKNPMYGKSHSDETKRKIGAKTKERAQDPNYRKKISDGFSEESRRKLSDKMKLQKREMDLQFYKEKEIEAQNTGLDTVWVISESGNPILRVIRKCKSCDAEMKVRWSDRHAVYCSNNCRKTSSNSDRMNSTAFVEKRRNILHQQIMIYKDLQKEFGRDPIMPEWRQRCREKNVSAGFNANTKNPNVLKNYTDLKTRASDYNHRVSKVTYLDEKDDVYNLTVDDYQIVCVLTSFDPNNFEANGFFVKQCAEQPLSSFELCCLVEIFPNRHESIEDFLKTIKYAYLYGKSVTLGSSHWPETNRIQMRNRRIGTSLSGVTQFIARHSMNELREWCLAGYDEIQHWDEVYSEWLCVPRSNRTTTIKPSGTVSLLAGSTPGAHYPQAKHYIRRVRLMNNSEIIPMLAAAGYKIEPCIGSEKTTVVVEFPVKIPEENLKTTSEVSMWQKLELAAKLQEWWSDNSVSVTIDFDAETEGDQIADALDHYQYKLKSVSFLPRLKETTAYPQMPYETITEEQYNEMMKDIEPLVLTSYEKNKDMEVEIDNMCDGDKCLLK